jgi:hypothetical protein
MQTGNKSKIMHYVKFTFIGIFILLLAHPAAAKQPSYEQLKSQAEKLFNQKSYSKAHQHYRKLSRKDLTPDKKRWVQFRLADTLWRSQAGSKTSDPSIFEKSQHDLNILIRDIKRVEDRDRVWVEVHESLGDFSWMRPNLKNWGAGWNHYQQALDWWAGAKDIELARQRYLGIIWRASSPPWREPYYYYGYYGNMIPVQILENAIKISKSKADKVRAQFLLAMTLRQQGGWNQQSRVSKEFEGAIQAGKKFEWYDDALFYYAEWLANNGQVIILANGQQQRQRDYTRALELFRRILKEFKKGETRHYNTAKQRIENITKPVLGLRTSNIFLPDSEVQVFLNWRNQKSIDFSLYPVNLPDEIQFEDKKNVHQWLQQINLKLLKKQNSWSEKISEKKNHEPGQKTLTLEKKLPIGAYILQATGASISARELILVTDASLILKASGKQALVYFCNVLDGSPILNANVSLWERYYDGKKWRWHKHSKNTDENGLAVFDLKKIRNNEELFAAAFFEERQAFSRGSSNKYYSHQDPWKVYVFTDRPAYRPNETAEWKMIARTYDGSIYSTPADTTVEFRITDPRGSTLKEGKVKLNQFGSAWDSLELTESMPLGEYRVTFWTLKRKKHIGNAVLFRLEEYKLPEFKVSIKTPEENGKKKTYRLGDRVSIDVQAEYYFGGPVANANVEIMVYQLPFHHHWHPQPDYPWYYQDIFSRPLTYWMGQGQQIKREVLKTDAMGKATLTFDTPRGQQDLQFKVEARVTDSSRREVVATDSIKVTKQSYYVYLKPEHNLFRPQDKVKVQVKTLDANNQAVKIKGTVQVTRDYWFEIWLDPTGKEVKGNALDKIRQGAAIFPPPITHPGAPSWKLKFRGYQHDEILTRTIKTDDEGEAELSFTPEQEGYYRIAWTSEEKNAAPIQSETTVWVATHATTELGYRHGGLEIIVDKETFRVGQKAPIMLSAPTNDRYVLFSVEGDDLYSYQLIHLKGSVKLVELDIEEKHVPNVFLNAIMVSDRHIFQDSKQVIVPPVKNFLKVTVESDKEQYLPGEEGTLTVTTRDHEGKTVSAEVSLGLVDESVYYIQKDLAQDPRQFFFGKKRQQRISTQSTFQMKSYKKLVADNKGQLIDELQNRHAGEKFNYGNELREEDSFRGRKGDYSRLSKSKVAKRMVGGLAVADMSMEVVSAPTMSGKASFADDDGFDAKDPNQQSAVQVRSDFRTTIFWQPDVITDKNGQAIVKLKFPDSLTQWRATARVTTTGNQFGIDTSNSRTRKPLIVRLQAPRFFVVGDKVTISANINNNTNKAMSVKPTLDADGLVITGLVKNGKLVKGKVGTVKVPANSEVRIDWQVYVKRPGDARLRVTARGKNQSDAMEKTFIVHDHGIEKFIARSGKMRGDVLNVSLTLPKARKPGSTQMEIHITPSLAITMLDAIPYLIDYPYGCTEQTMSRFLPAVITMKTLTDLGLSAESIAGKLFGGMETELVDKTHPKGKKSLHQLNSMVEQGLKRLADFQHSDGGWGWWKKGKSDRFMSAYVLWGLVLAQSAGVEVNADLLRRAYSFLDKELVNEELNLDRQAWMLHALSAYHSAKKLKKPTKYQNKAFDNLWKSREKLNAYSRSLLALSAKNYGHHKRAIVLVENLENGIQLDDAPDISKVQKGKKKTHDSVMATAHWGEDGLFWRWSDGGVEATAFGLRALLAIDPNNKLIEPVTNWLIKNRRGAHWSNTRDTAITLLALNDFLKASGELESDIEYEVRVNDNFVAKTRVEDVFRAPSTFGVDPKFIRDGKNKIEIKRVKGKGPLYFSAQAKFFSLEEPITSAGNEIFVRRQYYKLVGRSTLLKGHVFEKQPLNDLDSVTSGERIETVITIEAKNNYEYLIFEDLKPAGFEAVQLKSGEPLMARQLKSASIDRKLSHSAPTISATAKMKKSMISPYQPAQNSSDYTGKSRQVYQELRDRKMALFIDKLPEGIWEIRYNLRAEVPGDFHALPVLGHAMYIPEIRTNGEEIRVSVKDQKN